MISWSIRHFNRDMERVGAGVGRREGKWRLKIGKEGTKCFSRLLDPAYRKAAKKKAKQK